MPVIHICITGEPDLISRECDFLPTVGSTMQLTDPDGTFEVMAVRWVQWVGPFNRHLIPRVYVNRRKP